MQLCVTERRKMLLSFQKLSLLTQLDCSICWVLYVCIFYNFLRFSYIRPRITSNTQTQQSDSIVRSLSLPLTLTGDLLCVQ